MPKISVVVPVYQSASTIKSCAESILCQSFSDIAVILVDDGSTDGSGTICDEIAAYDPRVSVIHQPNLGRSAARFVGVKQSTSEWLSFVDSDDALTEDSLSTLFARASGDVDIVLGNGYTLSDEFREKIPMEHFRHLAVRGAGTIGVPWGSLYRRSLLTDYLFDLPRNIINGEDYIFWLRLVFSTNHPVNVVRRKVYLKGDEHTSNIFRWTAHYAQQLQAYRRQSIPEVVRSIYLSDELYDRIAILFAVSVWSPRSEWAGSQYYKDIQSDLKRTGSNLTLKQRCFLNLPSLRLRRWLSRVLG